VSRSSSVVRQIDCDALRHQARTAAPFPHVVIEDFLEADFADEVLYSWPSYDEAVKIGKSFRSINERNKVRVTNSRQFPGAPHPQVICQRACQIRI
jgi:hypothetical protein